MTNIFEMGIEELEKLYHELLGRHGEHDGATIEAKAELEKRKSETSSPPVIAAQTTTTPLNPAPADPVGEEPAPAIATTTTATNEGTTNA